MESYKLFLDDERTPLDAFRYTNNVSYLDNWVIVRNYDQFISHILKSGLPEVISFDHDLADIHYQKCLHVKTIDYDSLEEKTGYDCAKWLIDYCMDLGNIQLPHFFVHSMNVVGRQNINGLLNNYIKIYHGKTNNG